MENGPVKIIRKLLKLAKFKTQIHTTKIKRINGILQIQTASE
jgi:hypothetical protein